jgi:MFS family permease
MASRAEAIPLNGSSEYGIWRVILGSAVGTMIEWYDFYIFGSLAAFLPPKFYPPGNDTFAYIAYLATFAVGFVVRPFGALFFGHIGDLVGRRYAFLVILSIMGGSTALIGILPTYKTAGWFAPITCSKASRSAASTAAQRSSPSTSPTANAASTLASSRSPRLSASSFPSSSSCSRKTI